MSGTENDEHESDWYRSDTIVVGKLNARQIEHICPPWRRSQAERNLWEESKIDEQGREARQSEDLK